MDQFKKLFATLSTGQRVGIVIVTILVASGISGLVHWKHERDFRPLFTGMAPEDAAAIVQKVKESGVEYRIGENGTSVLVPDTKVDEIRLQLAGAGLPKTGRVGFELFDKTNLGITDFTEHVNYRRALEGELERSIKSLSELQQARVHITFPKDSVFLDSREPAKASVLVDVRPGASLTPQNVLAITNLVASAVEGLNPEFVSVVDMQGNLLSRPRKAGFDDSQASDAALDYKHQIEKDLTSKVESTLEPLLGAAKFRVGVSADCDFTTSEQSDEMYDPTKSVMVSSQRSEDLSGSTQTAGVPGTQSNTPRGSADARPAPTGSTVSRKTENVQYETTKMVRHVKTPQGGIKRISASVLLDQDVQWVGKDKQRHRTLVPASPEKIKAIHDLVAGVLGLLPDRGDQLIIESLPFEQTLETENPESTPTSALPTRTAKPALWADRRVLIGGGAALVIGLGAILFLLLRRTKSVELVEGPRGLEAPQDALDPESKRAVREAAAAALAGKVDEEQRNALQLAAPAKKVELLREHLKERVKKDPAFAASVLRGWLEEDAR